MTHVPLVDLGWQRDVVADAVAAGWAEVLARTSFIDGPDVAGFEEEFADFCGAAHCVGVSNGTDAIELALRALDVGVGDEVVVPANTFIATVEAVVRAGAIPRIADCDPDTLLIDPAAVEAAVTPATRAVIGVHLYGQMAPMAALRAVCDSHGLVLVEDAAQAQGATQDGAGIGTLGDAAATSFYPGKNLGAYGDAGAVLTDDTDIAGAVRTMRNHGSRRRYEHERFGFNGRLDTLQAVVLRAKLAHLADWNELRRSAAASYDRLLAPSSGVVRPVVGEGNEMVWHLYVVQVDDRAAALDALHGADVGAAIHYPVPVHLQPAFAAYGEGRGSAPVAEAAAERILSLPIYPGITSEAQHQVVDALISVI